ncbi:MAG: sugar ABC transporter permease [Chloroflexi bacterium]|jgi:multiple sugar transport system permease protein|nr:MAG: ABC transporter permease [Chloroflexi bacterium OLB13]MBC6954927.1 sugar ABC transporter permease [Chloroflexota bacterium]MBV6437435.1 Inner membrane ABC transporter permease protein YcjO [Anaerolineae bacterium]MDL1914644.1 sugar ABC transporter permease [Anaerolineae bacterium CFX4]OQY84247.1 MAG: ABC transporter permease [Anaerolineae bacterium UTCFX5]
MQKAILSRELSLLFLAPALVFIALFLLYPFFSIIQMSFTNQTLVGANAINPQNVGFQNYVELFNTKDWMRQGEMGHSLWLTVQFVIGSALIGQAMLGLGIATAFNNRKGLLREIVFTLAIAAWIIPDVVVAFAWFAYLDPEGTLNMMLQAIGIQPLDWLFDYPMFSIILFNTWRGTAFSMLLFSSALASIPPSYMETADVIGASPWQKFRDILLPLLRRYIATDLILITLWTFNTFTPFLLTGGGPINRTNVISIYTYSVGLRFFEFGKASAIAVVVMLINLVLASIYLFVSRNQQGKTA